MAAVLLAISPNLSPGIEGTGAPEIVAPRVETDIQIDGQLDEPVWADAVRLTGFWQYEPVDQRRAEEQTEVLIWYAPDAIYFGIQAFDSFPGEIRATTADRDNIDSEDHVVIYLDTYNDRRRSVFFAVNAIGIQQDGIRAESSGSAGRLRGGNIDKNLSVEREQLPEPFVVLDLILCLSGASDQAPPASRLLFEGNNRCRDVGGW